MARLISPIELDVVKERFDHAQPFRFFILDNFLNADFAREVALAYPNYEEARKLGFEFEAVNEKLKIQITDYENFPPAIKELADQLGREEFLSELEYVTGIHSLIADPELAGGGMHITGPTGRLDVHVDFNYLRDRQLHRRLNLLVYLNPEWNSTWGGELELWNQTVDQRHHAFEPKFNRCVIFETSEISYHGVTSVTCPEDKSRNSFATYYFTNEAPENWDGSEHNTVFRARPSEFVRGKLLMPAEAFSRRVKRNIRSLKKLVRDRLS